MAVSSTHEPELLEAARNGDESAFGRLIEPYRSELHAHCYRMLGSVHDAEDALQETMLRAWRALGRFEGRSSLRSWLYTIATNTSLNLISRRPKRVLPLDYGPQSDPHDSFQLGLPPLESVWVEPYADEALGLEDGLAGPEARYELRESVELAFVAALQNLPANQRAVLILREVLGFSANETAESLDTSVASVNSALQRARKTVDEKLPEQSQQATLRDLGDAKLAELVEGYMDAMGRGDVDAVMKLLADDASWSMPPLAAWFHGRGPPGLHAQRPAVRRVALEPRAGADERPAHGRLVCLVRARRLLPPVRARRVHDQRRSHRRDHLVHRPVHLEPRARVLPPLPGGAARGRAVRAGPPGRRAARATRLSR